MILWSVLTIMIAVAAIAVATPFIRRLERRNSAAALDMAVFRDQLKEVESEAAQGLMDAAQAESAKAEIKRRALAISGANVDSVGLSGSERSFAAVGVAIVVVGGAVALFALTANLGSGASDGVDEQAEASEPAPAPANAPSQNPRAAQTPSRNLGQLAPAASAPAGKSGLPPVDELIQKIARRLEANPNDVAGWRMLGWSYAGVERYEEAADAYGKAIDLAPSIAQLRSARADALVRANGGSVTPVSMILVEEALRLDPRDPMARYLTGLSKEQSGDKAGAIAEWTQIVAEGDPNDGLILEVKQKLAGLQSTGQAAGASATPAPRAPGADRGPTAEDVRRSESMTPADRSAMIRGMVDTLAARLEQSPRDADGWLKLIRSRMALNEKEQANDSYKKALAAFSDDAAARDRISAAGREFGLSN